MNSTSYNDEGLNPATEYCYTVVSVCENGESEHSSQTCATTDELIIPCDAPNNLDATVEEYFADYENKFEVTLTWDEVDNAEAYVVYMNGEKVEEVTTPSYIYGCNEEMTIEFSVTTKCDTGESEMSDTITVEVKHNSITELEDRFEIFPNPVKNTLIIRSNDKINDVVIYNVVGITILNVDDNFDNISVADLLDGIYFVKINTDHGDIVKIYFKSEVAITELNKETALFVYPNPAKDNIKIIGIDNQEIEIISIDGKSMFKGNYDGASLDVSNFPQGTYIINIQNNVQTLKFSKI